jgi:hypothetical protein
MATLPLPRASHHCRGRSGSRPSHVAYGWEGSCRVVPRRDARCRESSLSRRLTRLVDHGSREHERRRRGSRGFSVLRVARAGIRGASHFPRQWEGSRLGRSGRRSGCIAPWSGLRQILVRAPMTSMDEFSAPTGPESETVHSSLGYRTPLESPIAWQQRLSNPGVKLGCGK